MRLSLRPKLSCFYTLIRVIGNGTTVPPPTSPSALFTANEDGTFAITNMPTTLPTDPQFTAIGDGNMSWT